MSNTAGALGLAELMAMGRPSETVEGLFILPKNFGNGYIKRLRLNSSIDLLIQQYELAQDMTLKRSADEHQSDRITFSFRNVLSPAVYLAQPSSSEKHDFLPSVQISSGNWELDFFFPAKTLINTLLITVHVSVLSDVMRHQASHPLLQTILSGSQPYLYEELASSTIQQVAAQLVTANVPVAVHDFYLKIKAQELICLFFAELLKRQQVVNYSINASDIRQMYRVKDNLLADLSSPPNLTQIAHVSGMSESKLKRLFKQIFGSSIYQYYQTFRLNEAAYLIKEQKLSIAETGYRLGFANLSHFARIFEKHVGQKPKKYAKA